MVEREHRWLGWGRWLSGKGCCSARMNFDLQMKRWNGVREWREKTRKTPRMQDPQLHREKRGRCRVQRWSRELRQLEHVRRKRLGLRWSVARVVPLDGWACGQQRGWRTPLCRGERQGASAGVLIPAEGAKLLAIAQSDGQSRRSMDPKHKEQVEPKMGECRFNAANGE